MAATTATTFAPSKKRRRGAALILAATVVGVLRLWEGAGVAAVATPLGLEDGGRGPFPWSDA